MKYYVFDPAGTLLSSLDTRTGGAAYNTATKTAPTQTGSVPSNNGGTDVATIPKAILPLATFWTDTAPMPTDWRQMDFPIVQYGTSHPSTMGAEVTMNSAGYISGLSGNINGRTTATVYFQIYKNGQPFGIIASGSNSTDKHVSVRATGGQSKTFAANDVLSYWVKGDDAQTNQSFSATIEVTFT